MHLWLSDHFPTCLTEIILPSSAQILLGDHWITGFILFLNMKMGFLCNGIAIYVYLFFATTIAIVFLVETSLLL